MKTVTTMIAMLAFLTACAATAPPAGKYSAYCKTHATTVTLDESPDVEGAYQDCLHKEGIHEIEVTKTK